VQCESICRDGGVVESPRQNSVSPLFFFFFLRGKQPKRCERLLLALFLCYMQGHSVSEQKTTVQSVYYVAPGQRFFTMCFHEKNPISCEDKVNSSPIPVDLSRQDTTRLGRLARSTVQPSWLVQRTAHARSLGQTDTRVRTASRGVKLISASPVLGLLSGDLHSCLLSWIGVYYSSATVASTYSQTKPRVFFCLPPSRR
jgi:hypothetical protein